MADLANPSEPVRVLCIDGGGAKGMYSLGVLLELEALLGQPLHQIFHAIYGTSTGAIIAASLAYGLNVQSTLEQYRENLPSIMSAWRRTARRDALVASLRRTFGDDKFDAFKTHVALVATNFGSRHPLIFKTNIQAAHGLRSRFVPGFGCTIVDAVCASCSAFPFFPKAEVVVNQEPVTAIDGGFVANDPSLFAFIDLVHAARIDQSRVRILSVGTGAFPERVPLRAKWQLFQYAGGADLMQRQFDIGSNVIQKVAQLTIPRGGRLRVHDEIPRARVRDEHVRGRSEEARDATWSRTTLVRQAGNGDRQLHLAAGRR